MHEAPKIFELGPATTRRFEILETVGRGASGEVYRAIDRVADNEVAMKVLRDPRPGTIASFKREFRSLAELQHPNIAQLYELLQLDGQWVLTMEFIRGGNFLDWVRPNERPLPPTSGAAPVDCEPTGSGSLRLPDVHAGALDEARLRDALLQIASGLDAVHSTGRLHRDIKPGNVMVTEDGRVVICDFGLVADLASAARGLEVVGTASYMSPEQARGAPLGAASDYYSLGVMLYEALSGVRPFSGEPRELLLRKQRVVPVPPSDLTPQPLPADLEELAMRLLSIDPDARPDLEALRETLGVVTARGLALPALPLIAREEAMATLDGALQHVRRSGGHVALVLGAPGTGKSALLHRFADELKISGHAQVVEGACHPRESVPHRALDELLDGLVALLSERPPPRNGPGPDEAVPLLQLFPSLAGVPWLAQAAAREGYRETAPREARRRALAALRRLFDSTSEGAPWVLVVDDLHWGDEESLPILSALLGHPASPSVLFLASAVIDPDADTIVNEMLRRPNAFGGLTRIDLAPLEAADASLMAAALLGCAPDDAKVKAVVELAGGNPFLIRQSAIETIGRKAGSGPADLDVIVRERLDALDPDARALLEVASVASSRETLRVIRRATGHVQDEARAMAALRAARLLREGGLSPDERIETYHDGIRSAVRASIPAERRVSIHRDLHSAIALSRPEDHASLLVHSRAAGMTQVALDHALEAAHAARVALSFERSARLFVIAGQIANQLDGAAGLPFAERRAAAEVLALAGRGAESGRAYLRAATHAPSDAESYACERAGAGELLRSGYVEDGEAALRAHLQRIGAPSLSETEKRERTSRLQRSLRLATARAKATAEGWMARIQRDRLPDLVDAYWEGTSGLCFVDPIRAAELQLRHLRLSEMLGDDARLARALGAEGFLLGSVGRSHLTRAHETLQRAERLAHAKPSGHRSFRHVLPLVRGVIRISNAEYPRGRADVMRALRDARENAVNAWELAVAETFLTRAMLHLGEFRSATERLRASLGESEPRSDRFLRALLVSGACVLSPLANDEPDAAAQRLARARAEWPTASHLLPHSRMSLAETWVALYRGGIEGAEEAREVAAAAWADLEGSGLFLTEHLLTDALMGLGLAELAVAREQRGRRPGAAHEKVAPSVKRLRRQSTCGRPALARLLEGLALRVDDANAAATVELGRAEDELRRGGMLLLAMIARGARGQALGGAAGDELLRGSLRDLGALGVADPPRFAGMWLGPIDPG